MHRKTLAARYHGILQFLIRAAFYLHTVEAFRFAAARDLACGRSLQQEGRQIFGVEKFGASGCNHHSRAHADFPSSVASNWMSSDVGPGIPSRTEGIAAWDAVCVLDLPSTKREKDGVAPVLFVHYPELIRSIGPIKGDS